MFQRQEILDPLFKTVGICASFEPDLAQFGQAGKLAAQFLALFPRHGRFEISLR